jgi:hypothetical protein
MTTSAPPTNVEILQDARELALAVGVVANVTHFVDVRDDEGAIQDLGGGHGHGLVHLAKKGDLTRENVTEKVCGVCIEGAIRLAQVLAGIDPVGSKQITGSYESVYSHNRVLDGDYPPYSTGEDWLERMEEHGVAAVVERIDQLIAFAEAKS